MRGFFQFENSCNESVVLWNVTGCRADSPKLKKFHHAFFSTLYNSTLIYRDFILHLYKRIEDISPDAEYVIVDLKTKTESLDA